MLLSLLAALSVWYIGQWWSIERARLAASALSRLPTAEALLLGFVTNLLDTLGIGAFATSTAFLKLRGKVADVDIPGTLNVGHALPTVAEAFLFVSTVTVDLQTLVGMIAAAVAGASLGARIVARLPRRPIQLGMGLALLVAAALFIAGAFAWLPGGGTALGLHGPVLVFAVGVSFVLGALMMLGVGLYAPCLILVSLLGMNPLAAFPIMMGSCAFLMPVGGVRFIRSGRYDRRVALGLAVGGIPGVLIATFVVKSLPMAGLRWLVVIVVLYSAAVMLFSAIRSPSARSEERGK